MDYKVGDKVRIKKLVAWSKVGGMIVTPGMAELSGQLGTINKVDWDRTVQLDVAEVPELYRQYLKEYWFSYDMVELVTYSKED